MADRPGHTQSIWLATSAVPRYPPLGNNLHTDVCIVGAGVSGLTTAYLLAREGRSVVVLDDGDIGSGETGRTTAHLTNALDDRYFVLERLHGEEGARRAAESHAAAIDHVETIVETERIDCGFARLDGYLFAQDGEDPDDISRELEAAHRAGLREVERLTRAPLKDVDTGACLRFPRQAQCHALQYLSGMARGIEKLKGRIFSGTRATAFEDGTPARVHTAEGFIVTAEAVVVATNTPVNDRVTIHTKQAAYRTYVIGIAVPRRSVTRALYWETGSPYHYLRLESADDADVLLVGGEDHKTGQADDTEERYARLESWTRRRFPDAGDIRYAWSGQVMEPVDGLAFIGRNPGDRNIYIVTGDSGNGMTHGTIAGRLLTDLIAGRENAWATLYDPGRITLRASGGFAKENLNVAAQYAALVTPGDAHDVSRLAPGAGAVMREGLHKIAVYRDETGGVHRLSAICPHLGCVVEWNDSEKSWDCPCHGSRFDARGQVLNGPAIGNLKEAD